MSTFKSKPLCPLCGSKTTYVGLNSIECIGTDCANYVEQKIDKIDWEKAFMELNEMAKRIDKDNSNKLRNGPIGPVSIKYGPWKTP